MSTRLFGTLFYSNYLIRAIALYRSLEAHCQSDFTLIMLCMDDLSVRILQRLRLPSVQIISVAELEREDPALAAVKAERSVAEYSWTCAPSLLLWLLNQTHREATVAYLDADLMFFSDPQPIFDEWNGNDILIHEHRFAPNHLSMQRDLGIFNVGFVGLRNSDEGWRCVRRWREQCLAACRLDPDHGLCGDQKYLEEWPALYDRLTVLQHKGAGLAPWNVAQYALSASADIVAVDGLPLIFYHYHAMRVIHDCFLGHVILRPAFGYDFTRQELDLIYRPYAKRLREAFAEIRGTDAGLALPSTVPPIARTIVAMGRTGIVSSSDVMDMLLRQLDRFAWPPKAIARLVSNLRRKSSVP